VVVYMAFIFGLSSISSPPSFPAGTDKGVHYLLYAGLAVLIGRALAAGRLEAITWRVAAMAALLSTLYGMSDEFHQQFVAGRSFEYWDLVADAVGASCGAAAVSLWGRMRP
jgi:VanZ family protein